MISISDVKLNTSRIEAWERARVDFAKTICHYCREGLELKLGSWKSGSGKVHVLNNDLQEDVCYADEVWDLKNPFQEDVPSPKIYFDSEFSQTLREYINLSGLDALSEYLEVDKRTIRQWSWGSQVRPVPSIRQDMIAGIKNKFKDK